MELKDYIGWAPAIVSVLSAISILLGIVFNKRKVSADVSQMMTGASIAMIKELEDRASRLQINIEALEQHVKVAEDRTAAAEEKARLAEERARVLEAELKRLNVIITDYQREIKFTVLFHMMRDPTFIVDVNTYKIVDANFAAVRQYGYSREELVLMKYPDMVAEPKKAERALSMRLEHDEKRKHKRRDGTTFSACVNLAFFSQFDSRYVITVTEDATDDVDCQPAA